MRVMFLMLPMLGMVLSAGALCAQDWESNAPQQDQSAKSFHDQAKDGLNSLGETEEQILNGQSSGAPTVDTGQVIQKGQDWVNQTGSLMDSLR